MSGITFAILWVGWSYLMEKSPPNKREENFVYGIWFILLTAAIGFGLFAR